MNKVRETAKFKTAKGEKYFQTQGGSHYLIAVFSPVLPPAFLSGPATQSLPAWAHLLLCFYEELLHEKQSSYAAPLF